MRFYLARWVGDGTEGNEYRPDVDAAKWAAIDFRPDPTRPEGRAVVAVEGDASPARGVVDLGDDTRGRSVARRNAFRSALGVDLQADDLRGALAELLIVHGTGPSDKTRWNRLQAASDGFHRVFLLGEKMYEAPAIVGATITDDFNRADSTTLGSSSEGWSWTETFGDIDIESNHAVPQSSGVGAGFADDARAESDLASADHYAQADVVIPSGSDRRMGVVVRFSASERTYYVFRARNVSSSTYIILRYNNGSISSVSSVDTTAFAGGTLRLEVDGSSLTAKVDGSTVLGPTTDANISTGTRTGLHGMNAAGVAYLDNFEAGDLGAVTPSGTGSASVAVSTTAEGARTAKGTATSNVTVSATASGTRVAKGTGTASVLVSATATGVRTAKGAGAADVSVSTTAAGQRRVGTTGAVSVSVSATATDQRTAKGTGAADVAVSTTGAGQKPTAGASGSAEVAVSATATGHAGRKATAVAAITITTAADGTRTGKAAGSATITVSTSAEATKVAKGTGSALVVVSTTATGFNPASVAGLKRTTVPGAYGPQTVGATYETTSVPGSI